MNNRLKVPTTFSPMSDLEREWLTTGRGFLIELPKVVHVTITPDGPRLRDDLQLEDGTAINDVLEEESHDH